MLQCVPGSAKHLESLWPEGESKDDGGWRRGRCGRGGNLGNLASRKDQEKELLKLWCCSLRAQLGLASMVMHGKNDLCPTLLPKSLL